MLSSPCDIQLQHSDVADDVRGELAKLIVSLVYQRHVGIIKLLWRFVNLIITFQRVALCICTRGRIFLTPESDLFTSRSVFATGSWKVAVGDLGAVPYHTASQPARVTVSLTHLHW